MSSELLAILEHLEREKGVDKEILLAAVESAMVSAVKKAIGAKDAQNIKVEIDRETGKISAFCDDKEIKSVDFGRIAAQTARQVMIQKIREAEKDVIYHEFVAKVGTIVSGSVYRFEKGNIGVDLFGRTEGIIPHKEQTPGEEFRLGDRIRAYILEVKKESKGSQIILSRRHPNFVRKLFELEVPEIFEGIVEIKFISREPGERTKIAVWSKDEKVDCVGACVGIRGSRVKNIVSELQGEKIDIIRWNDNIREYITAALSPAKISEIKLNKERQQAEVIVPEDQLSLAIGKHGQNVRLASKLVGWELDIRTRPELKEEVQPKEEQSLANIHGVGEKILSLLVESGFSTLESVANADVETLSQIKGIGGKKAEKIIKEAKNLLKR
ncbi:MAG: transcription termination factor NusA [Candidatus Omnitrophica bacterium]|nr:transcription termination factor NusA [Candidatus Omnitrophota bacterium]MDD5351869.1 transcription termination factor NusA [Candidatus Omnitrophota bacterium]MDD5550695.1 transcription termination factor NusA [Candidatus Omnitrophota bacterium]